MAEMSLQQIAAKLAAIDLCTLSTRTEGGQIASRPMSNNGEVDGDGACHFFTRDSSRTVADVGRDAHTGLGFAGQGFWATVVGQTEVIRDRQAFDEHWNPDLERWFEQGADTPGLVLLKVRAKRIRWWGGEDGEGELVL